MLQKTYHISDFSGGALEAVLNEVAAMPAYARASQVLLTIFEQNWDTGRIHEKTALIQSVLPKAEIAGITHYDDMEQLDLSEEHAVLSFLFFEKPAFSLCRIPLTGQSDEAVGAALGRAVNDLDHARCVMTLFAKVNRNVEAILSAAHIADLPIFGAVALVQNAFSEQSSPGYVFDGEACYQDTLMAVIFHGADLQVRASYDLGWVPVGRTMTVTGLADEYTVTEIDGAPAAEIYQKYLGLPYRVLPFNTINICEFPLIVERGPHHMARIPYGWREDGALLFQIPMRLGESLRFSYGLPQLLFSEVYADAAAFTDFRPEGMLMIACMNRMVFLRENERLETDAYRKIVPDAAFLHGNSEIFWNHNAGSEVHSALIVVGFKECEGRQAALPEPASLKKPLKGDKIIPLEYRLMTFIRAVTGDLEATTAELIHLKENLEDEVERKTQENERLSLHVVQTLAEAIDAKDNYTSGHSGRVARYSREIARRFGYSARAQNEIYMMGLLHDVGKIGVPDAVINKPGRLTDEEFEQIKNHPVMGARILKTIREMPKLVTGARWHHERYDGRGYPDGLSGDDIPEEARIIGVADAYDAMTSNRSYRRSMEQSAVREQIEKGRGTQFDPRFADIMLQMIDDDKAFKMREE